jgi:hypothetical protein
LQPVAEPLEAMMTNQPDVPVALRRWFVVHFWADILFALPLFIAPVAVLQLIGWQQVDPITARLVAAALFGIGIESWIGRNASRASFVTMLNLKVIWSATATIGIAWSIAEGAQGRPVFAWIVLGIFAAFHALWLTWALRLRKG